jgi:hypothetical protein
MVKKIFFNITIELPYTIAAVAMRFCCEPWLVNNYALLYQEYYCPLSEKFLILNYLLSPL